MAESESSRTGDQSVEDMDDENIGMLLAHKLLLGNNEAELANMDTKKVITQLMRRGLLSDYDRQIIDCLPTTSDKNGKIIYELQRRGPTAFDTFFQILNTINAKSAEKLLPVRHRILWFTSSPRYAAAVAYVLKEHFGGDDLIKEETGKPQTSYLLRRGRIFKMPVPTAAKSDDIPDESCEADSDEADKNYELVRFSQDVELYLAFPISERGDTPQKALKDVFLALGSKVTVAILSGVCVGVHGASGVVTEVKGGEVVLATEATSLDGHKRELPLSPALMEAKTHLSQLPEENPKWFLEAKEKLKELDQFSGIQNREHPRLVPHFDTIRQDVQTTPTEMRLPRALALDSDTLLFYDLCALHLGVERPWFSCKGVIDPAMLNNVDPAQDPSSVCALVSTFFAMEACKTIVDKLRQN